MIPGESRKRRTETRQESEANPTRVMGSSSALNVVMGLIIVRVGTHEVQIKKS
ncbi:hypothetical protein PISMIDRAFT_689559 [Pisolithus microcarpus 441]|uniref:Uncharacterized protein n=1 Tax=Pisolithus microcarpus 441 TaxID=765257 RepID=A0A0C9YPN7_9AGAM|nr:hypothetical protein PISMIDRAFT_689559 [Pisolithus microcarpus 441]